MARILSGGGKLTAGRSGLPGGKWNLSISRFTGNRLGKGATARRGGVTIMQRNDPAKGITRNDIPLGFDNAVTGLTPNTTQPNPTIRKAPATALRAAGLGGVQTATPKGLRRIVNRSVNRSIKKR